MQARRAPFLFGTFAALLTAIFAAGCVQVAQPSPTASLPSSSPAVEPPVATPPVSSFGTTASPSAGGSIVFVRDSDIWLAAPDGSGARQLTTDGGEVGYHDPSQAPDGSIFALRGTNQLHHLDRNGQPIADPVTLITLENGAEALEVAPDGGHLAYVTTGYGSIVDPRFGTPTGTFIYGGSDIATTDGVSVPDAATASMLFPSWLDAETVVVSDGVSVYVDRVGSDPQLWVDGNDGCLTEFDCPSGDKAQSSLSTSVVSPDGRLLAYLSSPYFGDGGRVMAALLSAPPAEPGHGCLVTEQAGFSDPGSFSADGSQFVFDDTRFDQTSFDTVVGEGVFAMDVDTAADDCGASSARLIAPGGAQPDWGAQAP